MMCFLSLAKKNRKKGEYHLTTQQYLVLSYLFRQSTSNNTVANIQVNQVGSFTVDTNHKMAKRSPTGNILTLNNL